MSVRAYRAYGLVIHSSLVLWPGGDTALSGSPDLVITHGFGRLDGGKLFSAGALQTSVGVPDVGEMTVRGGEGIELTLTENSPLDGAAVLAAGAGLAMALTQRGWFVLHGSSIRIGDIGVCVAGASGAGKSTILAEMHRRGHAMIADGMTPLRLQGDRVVAAPGPPIMKVWPNTAREMGWVAESLPMISAAHDKRFYSVEERVEHQLVPIHTVLSVVAADPVAVSTLEPREALMELVKHAFLMEFSDAESGAVFLRHAAQVLPHLNLARLSRGTRLEDLSRVAAILFPA